MTREELAKIIRKDYEEKGVWAVKTAKITMQLDFEMFFIILEALEQEPKIGNWIVDGSVDCYLDKVKCHCSECGKKKEFPADYDHIKQELSISYKHPEFIDNYCPNCGAKMSEIPTGCSNSDSCENCKYSEGDCCRLIYEAKMVEPQERIGEE